MKGRWESNINVWFVEDRMLITRRVRVDWLQGIMHAFYRNMSADLPVDDFRISARVARTFSPATGFDLCIPRNETVQPRYFQNRIIMFCLPIPTLMYLWDIYKFPGSVCQICCSQICRPILGIYKQLKDTWCRNWDWGRAIPFPGKHKLDFRYSVVNRPVSNFVLEYDKDSKIAIFRQRKKIEPAP